MYVCELFRYKIIWCSLGFPLKILDGMIWAMDWEKSTLCGQDMQVYPIFGICVYLKILKRE